MKKNLALISVVILAICALSSVLLLVYMIISPPTFLVPSTDILPTPVAPVNAFPTFNALSTPAPAPTLTSTPTLMSSNNLTTPVAVGGACLTSLDYLSKIEMVAGAWEEFTPDFIDLMDKVDKNPGLISDSTWQQRMEIDLAKFDKSAGQLQALKAPRGLLKVDAQYKLAAVELIAFTSDARDAIHKQDVDALKKTNPHMDNFKTYMDKANSTLKTAKHDDTCP